MVNGQKYLRLQLLFLHVQQIHGELFFSLSLPPPWKPIQCARLDNIHLSVTQDGKFIHTFSVSLNTLVSLALWHRV